MAYEIVVLTTMSIAILFALSLNVITGFCGQVSLGHAAFYGIGAYTAALLTKAGVPLALALLPAAVVAGAVGFVVGMASLRVRHDFLAITTMGVTFLFVGFVRKQEALGGEVGISGIPSVAFGRPGLLALALLCTVLFVLLMVHIRRSWMGFAFGSVADNEDTARILGIDVPRFKLWAFVIGTAGAGGRGRTLRSPHPLHRTGQLRLRGVDHRAGDGHRRRYRLDLGGGAGGRRAVGAAAVPAVRRRLQAAALWRARLRHHPLRARRSRRARAEDDCKGRAMTLLRIEQVTMRFGGVVAVEDVSLKVDEGELLGFIGPNGAGKTTLMRIVIGVLRPQRGRVVFRGEDVTRWPVDRRIRAGLALAQQIVRPLLSLSLIDNVALAAGAHRMMSPLATLLRIDRESERAKARELLEFVGLGDAGAVMPSELPLGDSKRLEVARALALEPRLLLLDEPLAGLNQAEARAMADLIASLANSRRGVILIEHNIREVARICPRIYVQDNGRHLMNGAAGEIMASPELRRVYLGGERA